MIDLTRRARRRMLACALGLGSALLLSGTPALAQGPQMPDPRSMSGMARVDPGLPPGQVTVRCLLGSFAEPAIGVTVTLEVKAAGGEPQRIEAVSAEAGRATFTGLDPYIGTTATAVAMIDGQEVRSGPIPLAAQGGSRLLLVKGASAPAPGAGPMAPPVAGPTAGGPHGGAAPAAGGPHGGGGGAGGTDLPPFGLAFALEGRPPGVLVVGVLDMLPNGATAAEKIQPYTDHPVQVYAVKQDGTRRLLAEAKTDAEGRASFKDLSHEADERLVAESTLKGEAQPIASQPFDARDGAKAVVLLPPKLAAELNAQQQASQTQRPAAGSGPRPRRPMPPVVRDASIPPQTVRVQVVNKDDEPVEGVTAQVVRIDAARDERRFALETDAAGYAHIDVTETKKDALYYVEVIYDEAPYRTHLFDLPLTGGAKAAVRVFERTEDTRLVRSAVHFELNSLENDKARVLVAYEVMVDGDKAFWPRGGMRMWGPEGVTVAKPLPEAEDYLEEVEGAPFAKLTGPIPPGAPVKLSMAFIAKHDGSLDLSWDAPFPLVGARVAAQKDQKVTAGVEPGPGKLIEHGGPEPIRLHEIPIGEPTQPLCAKLEAADPDLHCPSVLAATPAHSMSFSMEGFTRRPPYVRWVALGVTGLILLAGLLAMVLRPRESRVDALRRRRDLLLGRLRNAAADSSERKRLVRALDAIYRQLEALGALDTQSKA